jgi:endonuclease/exonuclease/phosphatase family metal-dependent hydrolase
MDAIFEADADVIVLNEYDWGDRDSRHATFERKLREQGYDTFCRGTVFCPTAVATRFYVYETREIRLSEERSALALKVDKDSDIVWVIGTHLDHEHGPQRRQEIQTLLQDLKQHFEEDERIIILGDFNQQRRQDYSEAEWKLISDSMELRETCQDDGVATLLKEADFTCAWDGLSASECNWETRKPPSTHWSGTIVDYSYGRHVEAEGVSISPAGWSDHRMQVCDWKW